MPTTWDTSKVTAGRSSLFLGPANEPMIAGTVALDATWTGNWKYAGATADGWTLGGSRNTKDFHIDEQSTTALVVVESSDLSLNGTLVEDTLDTIKRAFGGGTIAHTTVPGVSTQGLDTLTLSDTLDVLAVGLESVNAYGLARRVYIPRVLSVGSVSAQYSRTADIRKYAASFRPICNITQISITDQLPATG